MSYLKGKARETFSPAHEASSSSSYQARFNRRTEDDDISFVRGNPLDDFIRHVLTANPTYEEVSKVVQKELSLGGDMRPFLRDIFELQNGDHGTPDGLLANFILGYRERMPCILDEDGLKKLRVIYDEYLKEKVIVPNQKLNTPIPFANESSHDYLARNSKNITLVSASCFIVDRNISQLSREAEIPDDSLDALLGVAGYLPEAQLVDKGKPLSDAVQSVRYHVIPGLESETGKAFVSLHKDDTSMGQSAKMDKFVKVVELFARLHFVVKELQRTGKLNDSLVYWRQYAISPRDQRGGQSSTKPGLERVEYHHVAVAIAVVVLDELVEALHKTHAQLIGIERPSPPFWAWQAGVAGFTVASIAMPVIGSIVGLLLGGIFGAVGAIGRDRKLSIDQALHVVVSKTKDILAKHEIPLPRNEDARRRTYSDVEQLSDVAAVGQFLCLVLQTRFRDANGALEFDKLLDRSFGQFELNGTSVTKAPIQGSLHPSSCFPERDILVFGDQRMRKSTDVLVATPAEFLNLCTTAKPLFRNNVSCFHILLYHGHYSAHICQGNLTESEFVGILVDDGIILPEISSERLDEWQWHRLSDIDIDMLVNLANTQRYKRRATASFTDLMHIGRYKLPREAHFTQPYLLAPGVDFADPTSVIEQRSLFQMEELFESITEDSTSYDDRYSTSATSISGSPGRDDGDPSAGTGGGATSGNTRCLWESQNADKERRKYFRSKLRQRGTRRGRWEVSAAQVQLGIQSSAARVSASLSTKKRSENSYRNDLFTRQQIFRDLESQCCVVLSLHTGLMSRVALRHVIAYMLEKRYVTATDIDQPLLERLISLLKSDMPYLEWEHTARREGGPDILGKLNTLMKMAVDELYWTGMVGKVLHVLWPGDPGDMLWLEARESKWIKALKDTDRNTTLACVVSDCRDTPDCRCLMRHSTVAERAAIRWRVPSVLRLATQVYTLRVSSHEPTSAPGGLWGGKTYWMSSSKLNLLGKVIGCVQDPETQRVVFYISVRNSSLPGWIKKYLSKYESIFEASDGDGVDYCVIGSGQAYEE